MVSGIDIARRSGGKGRYQENPNWAVQPLLRLVETDLIETELQQPAKRHRCLPPYEAHIGQLARIHFTGHPHDQEDALCDDDKGWREIVSVVFEDAGYEVLTAKDATEAMRLTEGVQLASIILDLNLNGEDGLELMKFFQCNQSGVPVILYTGMSHDDDTILAMLRQGAHQYVRQRPIGRLAQRPSRGRCCEFTKAGSNYGSHGLVVDDDPVVHLVLRRVLEGTGAQVARANNGREALEMATRDLPQLTSWT